jgi:hypothetical protein
MALNVMHELQASVHILSRRYRAANGQGVQGCLQITHKLVRIRFDYR